MTDTARDREAIGEVPNPLGLDGIEFIEYATTRPQALGQVLEMMGFRPVARHRSREVLLYRQGGMNVVINAHAGDRPTHRAPTETPVITAVALRVRDAAAAFRRAIDRGAWAVPTQVAVMELNIPAIHGAGASWPGCTGSASCSTSVSTVWTTGPPSTARCSASTNCRTRSDSASCPRAASCAAPAAASTCS